jgi:hypothetical protein
MNVRLLRPRPGPGNTPVSEEAFAALLQRECAGLSLLYRSEASFGCDPELGWWVSIPDYPLPEGLLRRSIPLIVSLPRDYPSVSPSALYAPTDADLNGLWPLKEAPAGPSDEGSVGAPEGWNRYAAPNLRWREGDDLDRILDTLRLMLEAAVRIEMTPGSERPEDT